MLSRQLRRHTVLVCLFSSLALLASMASNPVHAQDDNTKPEKHGRKYKAPPETSNIEVTVIKGFNKKPIMNAAVIFHPVDSDGKDEGFLEMKTDPDGKAKIDVIPTGSQVRIQVIATGFSTYADDYKIEQADRKITIAMIRPRAQVSTYLDESGKPSQRQPGIQEPIRPKPASGSSSGAGSSDTTSTSGSSASPSSDSTGKPQ